MPTITADEYDLGINVATSYDPARALNLRQAAAHVRGNNGSVNHQTLARWANPAHGYRSRAGGLLLVFPTVQIGNERLTMPEWIMAFEKARAILGMRSVEERNVTTGKETASHRQATENLRRKGFRV